MSYLAVIEYWSGDIDTLELPENQKMAQDIADAVEGQYTFIDNETGLCVLGDTIKHIDIYKENPDGTIR